MTTVGREFWRITLEALGEAMAGRRSEYANPDEPAKFKAYRGVPRRPLTTKVPRALNPVTELDDPALSTLLHHAYGISRLEFGTNGTWPYHRMVASARCLFAVQLYVCLPDGVYHYDAPHHTLALLRAGDHRQLLADATASAGSRPEAVVVLSALFWKAAFIYRDYAYRLCTEEAGLLTGNIDMVASAMGLRTHVHHQFLDQPVNRLLGLDGDEESALTVLPIHLPGAPRRRVGAATGEALSATIDRISPQVRPTISRTAVACPTLTSVNRACFLSDTKAFATAAAVPVDVRGGPPLPLPGTEVPPLDLANVLRSRDSGPPVFTPAPRQVDGVQLWARLAHIRTGVVSDAAPDGGPVPLEIFLTLNEVDGVPPGAYWLNQATGALHPVGDADPVAGIGRASIPGPVFTGINAVVHLVGDRDWAFDTFGDRGYRVLNQEGGLLAHRVCVAAAALGMSGRITNAYDAAGIRAVLGLTGSRHTPVFQILLASTGPGQRLVVPVEPEGVD